MRTSLRMMARAALTLALAGGTALATAPASAAGFHGGFGGGGGFHGGGGFGGYHSGFGGYHGGYHGGFGGYGYRGCCYGGYYGGFGFGEALLGAAIIGSTAAIIADQPTYYETYPAPVYAYPPPVAVAPPPPPAAYGYAPPPPPQQQQAYQSADPVDQCSRAAVDEAASHGDSGRVARIDRVDPFQNGAHVTGTLEVRRSDRNGAVENARFTCTASYGQVTAFRFG